MKLSLSHRSPSTPRRNHITHSAHAGKSRADPGSAIGHGSRRHVSRPTPMPSDRVIDRKKRPRPAAPMTATKSPRPNRGARFAGRTIVPPNRCPQKRQVTAASLTSSAQSGHLLSSELATIEESGLAVSAKPASSYRMTTAAVVRDRAAQMRQPTNVAMTGTADRSAVSNGSSARVASGSTPAMVSVARQAATATATASAGPKRSIVLDFKTGPQGCAAARESNRRVRTVPTIERGVHS